jgi:hypothetical protein
MAFINTTKIKKQELIGDSGTYLLIVVEKLP